MTGTERGARDGTPWTWLYAEAQPFHLSLGLRPRDWMDEFRLRFYAVREPWHRERWKAFMASGRHEMPVLGNTLPGQKASRNTRWQ